MHENEYIGMFSGVHRRTPYSADAEIVKTPDGFELFSIDGFSETDDFFENTPPEQIGNNLAVAACSDLLACGAVPEILLQSWNIDEAKGMDYYKKIACGIEKVLKHYNADCIGGDIGTSVPWSYTAAVRGHSGTVPVTRTASRRIPFTLYSTGLFGEANLAAFLREPMPKLKCRPPVPPGALFATDSSGGFFDALENFRRVNHGMCLRINLSHLISPEVFGKWPEKFDPFWTLIGGVGEYELLFAMPRGVKTDAIRIGEGDFSAPEENDFALFFQGKETPFARMKTPPPDYRAIPPGEWVNATKNYILRELL